jgi:hypothetical protein
MNRWLIALGIVAILLAATNPTRQDFNDWAVRYTAHKIDQQARRDGREASQGERVIGGALVGLVVSNLPIKRRNFILFSIYSLDTDVIQPGGGPGDNFPGCALGVAGQFIGFEKC